MCVAQCLCLLSERCVALSLASVADSVEEEEAEEGERWSWRASASAIWSSDRISNWRWSSASRSAPSSGEIEHFASPLGGDTLQDAMNSALDDGEEEAAKKDSSMTLSLETFSWFFPSSLWPTASESLAIWPAGSEGRGS